jgi:hypothetical protein
VIVPIRIVVGHPEVGTIALHQDATREVDLLSVMTVAERSIRQEDPARPQEGENRHPVAETTLGRNHRMIVASMPEDRLDLAPLSEECTHE